MQVSSVGLALAERIGATASEGHPSESILVSSPATGEQIASIPRLRSGDVDAVVFRAAAAQQDWRRRPVLERAALVNRLADVLDEHEEELARLDAIDNGSPISYFRADVRLSSWSLRYFAGLALELKGVTIPGEPNRINYTLVQPFGVVARITPFNHPLMFAARGSAAPLVAGNVVVIKPSEHTSLSTLRFIELADQVFGPGVVSAVTGYGAEAGAALVATRTSAASASPDRSRADRG